MADLLNTNPNDNYGDDAIVTLSPREHIRLRPGMYIGKLGDGAQADDGIYVLIKEVVDNSVDEFIMGVGRQIDISIADNVVSVRDYGRGIPLKSLAAAVSEMNTGGKYGGLQEDRRPERRRRQGRQHAFERIHGPFGPRRRSPHGDLRAGTRTERYVGERREGEERHFHLVPR